MRIDDSAVDMLNNYIRKIVREEIQKSLSNLSCETYRDVKVLANANNNTSTTVEDMTTGERLSGIQNKSGEAVTVGQIVRLYETQQSKYIGLAL